MMVQTLVSSPLPPPNQHVTYRIDDEAQMLVLGQQFIQQCTPPLLIFLHGQLGAGKTTLTRAMLRGLGFTGVVKSPSYALLEHYVLPEVDFLHVDLYRLADPRELAYLGIADYLSVPRSICVMEWAERGNGILPIPDITCYIDGAGQARPVQFYSFSERGRGVLVRLAALNGMSE